MAVNENLGPKIPRSWYDPNGPADGVSSSALQARWKNSAKLSRSIQDSLARSKELPKEAPTLTVKVGHKDVALVDLRGFDFHGTKFGEVDLTYCCLDFSDFRECTFEGTSLQFSTFRYSKLDRTRWNNVQASPVSLRGAQMRQAHLSNCFMMHSDLNSADLSGTSFVNSSLAGSDIRDASLNEASLKQVDLRSALLSDVDNVRDWYDRQRQDTGDALNWIGASLAPTPLGEDAVVMVVDDSQTTRRVLTQQLHNQGYRVLLAEDGIEAIEQLGTVIPDLVLLDIEMPRMDGLEVVRILRRGVTTSALPVVIITARTDKNLRQEAVAAGATEYFTKPLASSDLMTRIKELLATHHRHHAT